MASIKTRIETREQRTQTCWKAASISSATAHLLNRDNPILKEKMFDTSDISSYRRFVQDAEDGGEVEEIRRGTGLGKSFGGIKFISRLAELSEQYLKFRPKGRPTNSAEGI